MADNEDWGDENDDDWGEFVEADTFAVQPTARSEPAATATGGISSPAMAYGNSGGSGASLEARVHQFMTEVDQTRMIGIQIRRRHREKMQHAFLEFSRHCTELMTEYNNEIEPLRQRLNEIKMPLANLLEKKYVSIPCPWLEHYFQASKGNSRANNDQKTEEDTVVSFDPIKINDDPRDQVLKYFQSVDEEVRKEMDSQIRAPVTGFDLIEKREANADNLIGMVPWITHDMALAALKMKNESLEQTANWLISGDANDLYLEIHDYVERNPDFNVAPVVEDRHQSDKRVLNRSVSQQVDKEITYRVESVSSNGRVRLCAVLDRNRIPIDPLGAKTMTLDMDELFTSGLKIPNVERVVDDVRNRQMKIIIQCASVVTGVDLAEQAENPLMKEYHPIAVEPPVRLAEYEMNINPRTGALISIRHRTDGKVLGDTVVDDGSTGMLQSATVDLYTQVLDDVTHNVVMILMDDFRDELTFDVVNLSFTSTTVEEYKQFETDASGRRLQYRIVVKDQEVKSVLAPVGNEIKAVNFVEHRIPAEGTLVELPNNNLGLLQMIPTGLIITNRPDPNIDQKVSQYPKEGTVMRKHVADLNGYVDVHVVRLDDHWLIESPLHQAHPICNIREANDDDLGLYMSMALDAKTTLKEEFVASLAELEELLDKLGNRRAEFTSEQVKEMSGRTQELLSQLREQIGTEDIQGDADLASEADRKLKRFGRGWGAIKMEIRMGS